MIIGVPREIKSDEYRVAMVPSGVEELTRSGHVVLVESGAGLGSGIPDDAYAACGAKIISSHADVFAAADQDAMDRAEAQKLLAPGSRHNFAGNTLVLVTPVDSTLNLKGLADLQAGTLGDAQLRALGDLVDAHRAFGTGPSLEALDLLETEWLRGRHG